MQEESVLEHVDRILGGGISSNGVLADTDRWQLAHSCSGFYAILRNDLLKKKLYSTGIIPLGLLEHEIFKAFEPNLAWLCEFFHQRKFVLSQIHLDDKLAWPLMALMGMDDAIEALFAKDPKGPEGRAGQTGPTCEDRNGFSPLFYFAMGGHKEAFQRWVEKYYPDFSHEKYPNLLSAVLPICADENILTFLMETYGYTLCCPQSESSAWAALYAMTEYGHENFFYVIADVLAELEVDFDEAECVPLMAVKNKHWDLADTLMANGFELSEEQQAQLACYAARDDHQRFLTLLEQLPHIDFSQFNFEGNNVYTLACEGGNLETVQYIVQKRWFSESKPDFTVSRATGTLIAAQYGHMKLLEYFFKECGADVNQRDANNRDLMDYAAMHGDWFKFQYLVKAYRPSDWVPAPPNNKDEKSPLNYAISAGLIYFVQQFILMYGIDYLDNQPRLLIEKEVESNPVMDSLLYNLKMELYDGDFVKAIAFYEL